MSLQKYLFLDRDGTIIEEAEDFQIDSVEKFKNSCRMSFRPCLNSKKSGIGSSW